MDAPICRRTCPFGGEVLRCFSGSYRLVDSLTSENVAKVRANRRHNPVAPQQFGNPPKKFLTENSTRRTVKMAHTKLWARTHGIILLLIVCLLLAPTGGYAAATWTLLKNLAPGGSIQLMIQMTDGTIMVQAYDGKTWMKLTP